MRQSLKENMKESVKESVKQINEAGMVVIGCGFMGKALLEGWLQQGVGKDAIYIQDPRPSDWVKAQQGFHINETMPTDPAVLVLAIKPQMIADVLPSLKNFGNKQTVILSIVTGLPLSHYENILGDATPVVRAMPNLPAAVGAGVSVFTPNHNVDAGQRQMVEALLGAVGVALELSDEEQMHAVTGISGSGPAYLFAMSEALTKAGQEMGLPKELAIKLANHTIAGAGKMLVETGVEAGELRRSVTSKGGTTANALKVLTDEDAGLADLIARTTRASCDRSIELGSID